MKLAHFLGLTLILAPLGAAAQSSAAAGHGIGVAGTEGLGGQVSLQAMPAPSPCPVAIQAKHGSDGNMVKTRAGHPKGLGQRLYITLTSPDARTLSSATFNVRGWTAEGHMEQAGTRRNPGQEVRTLQVPLTSGAGRSASADLWAPGLTSVESVELLAVSYADGSTWTPAAGKTCRVVPDPLMLIAQ